MRMSEANGDNLKRLVRARTCDGCRALENVAGDPPSCILGYKFDRSFRPLAPCPKPRTIRQFILCTNSSDEKDGKDFSGNMPILEQIMTSTQVQFRVYEREYKSRKEWALNAQFAGHGAWTIKTWERKPTEKEISDTKETIIRSFEFYHRHLKIPRFEMDIVDI